MAYNELWKPDAKIDGVKPKKKNQKKRNRSSKTKISKRAKNSMLREELIAHFRLHKYASNAGICLCISNATGTPVPGKDNQLYGYMRRYLNAHKQGLEFRPDNIKHKPTKTISDDQFYSSKKWLELRYIVLKKYEGACCLCGATAKDGVQIHVDHIKPRSRNPELQYDIDNFQLLCSDCNCGKSNYDDRDWRLLM